MENASTPADRGRGPWRALSALLFLLLLVGSLIVIVAMIDIAGTPTCHDVRAALAAPSDGECYDGSSLQKTLSVIIGFGGGATGAIAMVSALAYTITGRRGRFVLVLTGLAIVLSGISIVVGSI